MLGTRLTPVGQHPARVQNSMKPREENQKMKNPLFVLVVFKGALSSFVEYILISKLNKQTL